MTITITRTIGKWTEPRRGAGGTGNSTEAGAITYQDLPGATTAYQDLPYTYRAPARHRLLLESWNAKRQKTRISRIGAHSNHGATLMNTDGDEGTTEDGTDHSKNIFKVRIGPRRFG